VNRYLREAAAKFRFLGIALKEAETNLIMVKDPRGK
jgi:hypothetical protein